MSTVTELIAFQNVYLHPAYGRSRGHGSAAYECILKIENYEWIAAAFGEGAAEFAHGELLARLQGYLADAGLACPEKDGAVAVLVWDPSALAIGDAHREPDDWLQAVCNHLLFDPVVSEFGQFHMKVGVEQLSGFGSDVAGCDPVAPNQGRWAEGASSEAARDLYKADMAAVSPILTAISSEASTESLAPNLCVCWRPLAGSKGVDAAAVYEALIGNVDLGGQIRTERECLEAAERLGFISHIDRFLLNAAIDELASGTDGNSLIVSISVGSLADATFWSWLAEKLFHLPGGADSLCIELRGHLRAAVEAKFLEKIAILRRFGCRISIGQFGICEGAFRDLVSLAPEMVTIDKYFLGPMERQRSRGDALTHLVGLAHSLGAVAVVDGVDDPEASAFADAAGASFKKGSLCGLPRISRPWKTLL